MPFLCLRTPATAMVAAFAIALPRLAAADERDAPKPYTSHVVVADLASFGVIGAGYAYSKTDYDTSAKIGLAGMLGYMFVTPIFHFARGRVVEGLVSSALRFAVPYTVLSLTTRHTPGRSALVFTSLAGPTVLDAAVFSRPAPPDRLAPPSAPSAGLRVAPYFGGTEAGLSGTF